LRRALQHQLRQRLSNVSAWPQVMAIAQLIRKDFDGGKSLSGIGGVETGRDAAEFLLLGADTVQVARQCSLCRPRCSLVSKAAECGKACVGAALNLVGETETVFKWCCRCAPASCCTPTAW
jgi:hypothetical protein